MTALHSAPRIDVEHREGHKARAAWLDYVALGDGRSLEKLIQRYLAQRAEPGSKAPPTVRLNTLKEWSRWHGWQLRLERIANEAAAAADIELAQQWRSRRIKLRESEHEVSELIITRIKEMLRFPVARQRQERQGENGEVHVTIVEPARWNMDTIARLAQAASTLGRLATDQPTAINALIGRIAIREVIAEIPEEVAREYAALAELTDGADDTDSTNQP